MSHFGTGLLLGSSFLLFHSRLIHHTSREIFIAFQEKREMSFPVALEFDIWGCYFRHPCDRVSQNLYGFATTDKHIML